MVLAGCAGVAPEAETSTPAQPTDTTTPTATATPASPSTPTSTPVSVEYALRVGAMPDEFASVTATMRVVFVERPDDMGPCWRETYGGPYEPTVTPIRMPSGECHRSDPVTVDLTEVDGERSLGRFTAPGRFGAGHAMLVTDVTATYPNGTAVSGIRGATGTRANVVPGTPSGRYGVTLGVESYRDRPYDYWIVTKSEE
jgi:hypothetical protein